MRHSSILIFRAVLVVGLFLGMTACSDSGLTEVETDVAIATQDVAAKRGEIVGNPFDALADLVGNTESDFDKFYNKGNKAAGLRLLAAMDELRSFGRDVWVDIVSGSRLNPGGHMPVEPTSGTIGYDQLRDLALNLEGDFEKYYEKGNKAAGVRLLVGMRLLIDMAREAKSQVREEIRNRRR